MSWDWCGWELEVVVGQRRAGRLVVRPQWGEAGHDDGALLSSHWGGRGGGGVLGEEGGVRVVVQGQGRVEGGHGGGGVGGGNVGEDGEDLLGST